MIQFNYLLKSNYPPISTASIVSPPPPPSLSPSCCSSAQLLLRASLPASLPCNRLAFARTVSADQQLGEQRKSKLQFQRSSSNCNQSLAPPTMARVKHHELPFFRTNLLERHSLQENPHQFTLVRGRISLASVEFAPLTTTKPVSYEWDPSRADSMTLTMINCRRPLLAGTRLVGQVESGIGSIIGVPGCLLGARLAL